MTLQELSRYYKLQKRLERDRAILSSLEAAAHPGAQPLDGMPHASGVKDRVGDLAAEIADVKTEMNALARKRASAEREITAYIDSIPDSQTRMIFRLRFLRCLSWGEVAAVIGGGNSERGVKAICYRYIKSCSAM